MLNGRKTRNPVIGTAVLLAILLLGNTALLIYWMVEDIAENMVTGMLQRAEIQVYQLEVAIEEIVLTSESKRLSALAREGEELVKDIRAIYRRDPSYLYCIVQDDAYRVVFQDTVHAVPEAVYAPLEPMPEEFSEPLVAELTIRAGAKERDLFQLSIPLVIQDRYQGVLKLGVSRQELSEQIDRIARSLIQKHLAGLVVILIGVIVAAFQTVRLIRRALQLEAQVHQTDRLIFLGTITSGLAHELRNPLNALNLDSELLAEEVTESDGENREEIVRLTQSIGDSVQYLDATLSSFLRFARPANLIREFVDLPRLVAETIRFVEGECAQKKIQVEWEEPDGIPRVWADGTQLKQALLNLLLNAQQVMAEEGVLSVHIYPVGDEVCLVVSDTGPGIPRAEQEKIFNVFYSTKPGGSGMGLPIARRIVEEHGGRLELRSAPGKGSSFLVILKAGETPGDA